MKEKEDKKNLRIENGFKSGKGDNENDDENPMKPIELEKGLK